MPTCKECRKVFGGPGKMCVSCRERIGLPLVPNEEITPPSELPSTKFYELYRYGWMLRTLGGVNAVLGVIGSLGLASLINEAEGGDGGNFLLYAGAFILPVVTSSVLLVCIGNFFRLSLRIADDVHKIAAAYLDGD